MGKLLRVEEVAQRLGFKDSGVRRLIFERRIPVVKLGRAVRIREEDVDAIIKAGFRPAKGEGAGRSGG